MPFPEDDFNESAALRALEIVAERLGAGKALVFPTPEEDLLIVARMNEIIRERALAQWQGAVDSAE